MVPPGKWIKHLSPDSPVTLAARQSIGQRLLLVWHYAPLAANSADDDQEYVHQLRVSVRRAKVALDCYKKLLPKKKVKRISRMLRELRETAGEARDLDVFSERLSAINDPTQKLDLRRVLKDIARRRKQAQKPLQQSYRHAKRSRFKRQSQRLCQAIQWKQALPEPGFHSFAVAPFQQSAKAFLDTSRMELTDIEALHRMRIAGKRFRYAIELLHGAFENSVRQELYPALVEIQDKLGEINDHATAIRRLTEWREQASSKKQDVLSELIAREEKQLSDSHQAFLRWWSPSRLETLTAVVETELGD
jgi:CHAD domain-containing protein